VTAADTATQRTAAEISTNQWGAELVAVADDEQLRRFARDRS
jgi:hypothetical protein